MERVPLDLSPALKDGYLRKVAFTKGCETAELTFHVVRRALGSRESEAERTAGFRFRGVRGLATEALRWDRDAAKWVPAKVDWLGALARDAMERPIVGGASVDQDATLERWRKAAEQTLWLRGQPANLDADVGGVIATAPVLFEATAEVILPSGMNANARLFIAADALDTLGSRGSIDLPNLVRLGVEWEAKWKAYWQRRERRPEMPEEAQFEWMQPEGGGD